MDTFSKASRATAAMSASHRLRCTYNDVQDDVAFK